MSVCVSVWVSVCGCGCVHLWGVWEGECICVYLWMCVWCGGMYVNLNVFSFGVCGMWSVGV